MIVALSGQLRKCMQLRAGGRFPEWIAILSTDVQTHAAAVTATIADSILDGV